MASSEPRSRGEGSLGSFGSEVEVAAPVATTVHAHAHAHTVPIDAVKVVPDGSYGGGGENEDVIGGYRDSGDACQKRGDLLQALGCYTRARDGYTRLRGVEDENALKMSGMVASMLHKLGRQGEAIAEYRIVLEKKERVLGSGALSTLNTLSNFGDALRDNREWEEARKVMELSLLRKQQSAELGEDHPDTLRTLNNLGNLYFGGFKDYGKALGYFKRALEGQERVLRKNHLNTLGTVMNLASVNYSGEKDYGMATVLFERALEGERRRC